MEEIAHSQPATDLAAEMSVLLKQFDSCETCHKACSAAIAMLGVKVLITVRVERLLTNRPVQVRSNSKNH